MIYKYSNMQRRIYNNLLTGTLPKITGLTTCQIQYNTNLCNGGNTICNGNANSNACQCATATAAWIEMNGSSTTFTGGVCCGTSKGVTCDASNIYVTEIDWSSKGLTGRIPGYMSALTNLTAL
jgi:formylmethanofuran:tetrahydromethanopterin formyltransferase